MYLFTKMAGLAVARQGPRCCCPLVLVWLSNTGSSIDGNAGYQSVVMSAWSFVVELLMVRVSVSFMFGWCVC